MRAMFVLYAAIGVGVWWIYRRPAQSRESEPEASAPAPLGASRGIVVRLAALFSVDAFAGGLIVNSLLALWLLQRFGLSLAQAGAFFFWAGLLSAASQLAAPVVARRIGLLNTMVFTHIPANVCLVLAALAPTLPAALALLFIRSALSQMDVPTRTAYVMAVVTPPERPAAASFTAVPRSLARSARPDARRRALRRRLDRRAAGRLRRTEDLLRPRALALVPRRRARGALRGTPICHAGSWRRILARVDHDPGEHS